MALSQGTPGLPFQWGPDGYHQYADCWVGAEVDNAGGSFGAIQISVPVGRIAYVTIFDDVSQTVSNSAWAILRVATTDVSWESSTAMTLTANQLGSFDATSTVKYGRTDDELNNAGGDENLPLHSILQTSPQYSTLPIIVPGGSNFTYGLSVGNTSLNVGLRWLEKVVPT